MKFSTLKVIALIVGIATSNFASATIIYYHDRATFEAALSSFSVENMDDIVASQQAIQSFNDFDITFRSGLTSWGCTDDKAGCGSGSNYWTDFGALWAYDAENVFTFDIGAFAFGFDYGATDGLLTAPTLNGVARSIAGNEGAFFGAISSEVLKEWVFVNTSSSFVLVDNVTYALPSIDVPEPSTFPIIALAIFGLILGRFKRQS